MLFQAIGLVAVCCGSPGTPAHPPAARRLRKHQAPNATLSSSACKACSHEEQAVQGSACAQLCPRVPRSGPQASNGQWVGCGDGGRKKRVGFKEQTREAMMLRHVVPSLMFSERALGQHEAGGGHSAHQHAQRITVFQV